MNRAPRILVIQHNLDDHLNELAVPLMKAGIDIVPWDVENAPAFDGDLLPADGDCAAPSAVAAAEIRNPI